MARVHTEAVALSLIVRNKTMITQFIKLCKVPATVSLIGVSALFAILFSAETLQYGIYEFLGSVLTSFLMILLIATPVMIILGLPLIGLLWAKYKPWFERVSLICGTTCGAVLGFLIHYCLLLSWGGWSDPVLIIPVGLIGGIYAAVFTHLFIKYIRADKVRTCASRVP